MSDVLSLDAQRRADERAALADLPLIPRLWRQYQMALRYNRRLTTTRDGRVVLFLTLAIGFAALNTGNNLLFFGWGLLLSVIVLSGIMSESTLSSVSLRLDAIPELRSFERSTIPLEVRNTAKYLPAFGIEIIVRFLGEKITAHAPAELRLGAGERRESLASFIPLQRGVLTISALEASTSYPFGFFEKSRQFDPLPKYLNANNPTNDAKAGMNLTGRITKLFSRRQKSQYNPITIKVAPARVDLQGAAYMLLSRLGSDHAAVAGNGEEFFALRPYQEGDDPRLIHWRRSARTGRYVVRENEAMRSREIMLVLSLPVTTQNYFRQRQKNKSSDGNRPVAFDIHIEMYAEHALAALASLAEDLLAEGHSVGIATSGVFIAPSSAPRHRAALLDALAGVDLAASVPPLAISGRTVVVGVVPSGWQAHPEAMLRIEVPTSTPAFAALFQRGLKARGLLKPKKKRWFSVAKN